MATEFAMPTPATTYTTTTSPTHYTLYSSQSQNHSRAVSPVSSVNATPSDSSPTSRNGVVPSVAHLPVHTRQLRPPKSPLYVPAVLRPTEPPRRNRISPPATAGSGNEVLKPLSRSSTGDSGKFGLGKITENEWAIGALGRVTEMPTRDHWKPDASSSHCDSPSCTRTFSYFTRRHHCRRCGNIFCDQHSSYLVPLDQNASFHPLGYRSRACEFCWDEYKAWEIARSRNGSEDGDGVGARDRLMGSTEGGSLPCTPSVSCKPSARFSFPGKGIGGIAESVSASVPRDWNWSTF